MPVEKIAAKKIEIKQPVKIVKQTVKTDDSDMNFSNKEQDDLPF